MRCRAVRTNDVVMPSPNIHVNGVQDCEEGEPPADSIDNDLLAALKELIYDGTEEEEVNEGPGEGGECGEYGTRYGERTK